MLSLSTCLLYYKREEIQKAILSYAADKEVAIRFGEGFGKRPDALKYHHEVLELVKQGATSFHCSEELWHNPLKISPEMQRKELDEERKGWDLVLDVDCKELEFSKIAADLIVKAIRHHGVSAVTCKYSGNHGFHIGVPFKAFPQSIHSKATKSLFPEGPRKIAFYLMQMIQNHLRTALLTRYPLDKIIGLSGKTREEVMEGREFDPLKVITIDTVLLASRHLYRMPYSLNEKSGLVSVPINPDKILEFHKAVAIPRNVKISKFRFLDSGAAREGEAAKLLLQSFDFNPENEDKDAEKEFNFEAIQEKMPFELFPPCIKLIDKGLKDGKKRAVFILINFLSKVGWSYGDIESYLKEWNKRNPEPLREVALVGQLRYYQQRKKSILPPNCANQGYYIALGVCQPDSLCQKIKNPVSYARRKIMFLDRKVSEKKARAKKPGPDPDSSSSH